MTLGLACIESTNHSSESIEVNQLTIKEHLRTVSRFLLSEESSVTV